MEPEPEEVQSSYAIVMDNASLDFGGGAGVFDLNFSLPQGSILGMIGPSGCGKTTTIRLLNGIYGPTSGDVRVFGKQPLKFDQADKARIGYIPQHYPLPHPARPHLGELPRAARPGQDPAGHNTICRRSFEKGENLIGNIQITDLSHGLLYQQSSSHISHLLRGELAK